MILMYHNIVPDHAPAGYKLAGITMRQSAFQEQAAWLARLCRVIPLETYLDTLQRAGRVPPRTLALTFDDGTAVTFEQALPVLERYHLPATFFVTTGHLESGEMMWGSYLNALCYEDIYPRLEIHGQGFSLETASQRRQARQALGQIAMQNDQMVAFVRSLSQVYPLPAALAAFYEGMRGDQLRLAGAHKLIEIGSHSVTHPFLSRLGREQQAAELARSKAILEAACGGPVRYFAYPSGDYNSETLDLLAQTGYRAACAVQPWRFGHDPLYELERTGIYSTSVLKLLIKISGLYTLAFRPRTKKVE
jgi:peptidoglycan/xylan/chitin deacetylase (PgdA/CDA1 family)